MTRAPLALVAASLLVSACGQRMEDRRQDALAAEPQIAPGRYANVGVDPANGAVRGFDVTLAEGSASTMATFIRCSSGCEPAEYVAVRRGLGGISFAVSDPTSATGTAGTAAGRVLVTVQAAGRDAVMLGADWGDGFVEQRLPRIDQDGGQSPETLSRVIPRP